MQSTSTTVHVVKSISFRSAACRRSFAAGQSPRVVAPTTSLQHECAAAARARSNETLVHPSRPSLFHQPVTRSQVVVTPRRSKGRRAHAKLRDPAAGRESSRRRSNNSSRLEPSGGQTCHARRLPRRPSRGPTGSRPRRATSSRARASSRVRKTSSSAASRSSNPAVSSEVTSGGLAQEAAVRVERRRRRSRSRWASTATLGRTRCCGRATRRTKGERGDWTFFLCVRKTAH